MATKSPTHWHSHDRPFSKPDSRSRKPYMQYWWRTTRLKSQIKVILSAFSGSFSIVATVCTLSYISRIRKWQIGTCGGHKDIVQFWWLCIAYVDVFNTVDRCRKRVFLDDFHTFTLSIVYYYFFRSGLVSTVSTVAIKNSTHESHDTILVISPHSCEWKQ